MRLSGAVIALFLNVLASQHLAVRIRSRRGNRALHASKSAQPSLPARWSGVLQPSLQYLTSGSFGDVFVASTKQEVCGQVAKVIIKRLKEEQVTPANFHKEVFLPTVISHPTVVKVYDFVPHKREPRSYGHLILQEFIGPELASFIPQIAGRKNVGEIARIALDIAQGVEQIHLAGWVYRDLKPRNTLITERGNPRIAKVIDFGLACERGTCLDIAGTAYYMSPEVAANLPADFPSDVWSLGITIVELWHGRLPFRKDGLDLEAARDMPHLISMTKEILNMVNVYRTTGQLPWNIYAGMPEALAALVRFMLQPNPAARPAIGHVITQLGALATPRSDEISHVPGCMEQFLEDALGDLVEPKPKQEPVVSNVARPLIINVTNDCAKCTSRPACYVPNVKCFSVSDGYRTMSAQTCGPGLQFHGTWCP